MGAGWNKKRSGTFLAMLLAWSLDGCTEVCPLSDLTYHCGFRCPGEGEGIVAGNASISGLGSLDRAFGAFVQLRYSVDQTLIQADDALASALGGLGVEPDSEPAELRAAVRSHFFGNVSALRIQVAPPVCSVSSQRAKEEAAACERIRALEPGSVSTASVDFSDSTPPVPQEYEGEVFCDGACERLASSSGECGDGERLFCRGVSPGATCEGSCSGVCLPEGSDDCDGACIGTCTSEAPSGVSCPLGQIGYCVDESGAACAGMCRGRLVVEGETPPCDVAGNLGAELGRSCEAPSFSVSYQAPEEWTPAEQDAQTARRAAFEAQAVRLFQLQVELEHLRRTCQRVSDESEAWLVPWIESESEAEKRLPIAFGLGCALDELASVGDGAFCKLEELEALSTRLQAVLLLDDEE